QIQRVKMRIGLPQVLHVLGGDPLNIGPGYPAVLDRFSRHAFHYRVTASFGQTEPPPRQSLLQSAWIACRFAVRIPQTRMPPVPPSLSQIARRAGRAVRRVQRVVWRAALTVALGPLLGDPVGRVITLRLHVGTLAPDALSDYVGGEP